MPQQPVEVRPVPLQHHPAMGQLGGIGKRPDAAVFPKVRPQEELGTNGAVVAQVEAYAQKAPQQGADLRPVITEPVQRIEDDQMPLTTRLQRTVQLGQEALLGFRVGRHLGHARFPAVRRQKRAVRGILDQLIENDRAPDIFRLIPLLEQTLETAAGGMVAVTGRRGVTPADLHAIQLEALELPVDDDPSRFAVQRRAPEALAGASVAHYHRRIGVQRTLMTRHHINRFRCRWLGTVMGHLFGYRLEGGPQGSVQFGGRTHWVSSSRSCKQRCSSANSSPNASRMAASPMLANPLLANPLLANPVLANCLSGSKASKCSLRRIATGQCGASGSSSSKVKRNSSSTLSSSSSASSRGGIAS